MSSLFKQFKMDEEKERAGIDITYAPNEDGSVPTFKVLRRGPSNQRYAKTLEQESAPFKRLIELGTLDNKTAEMIYRRVFCKAVLIDWANVYDQENKLLPYSPEAAMKLLEALPELYDDLMAQTAKANLWRQTTVEADAKN